VSGIACGDWQVVDAITRHLELGSYLAWPEEQRTTWLLQELNGKRPLFPPGMELSPDEQEVVDTFRYEQMAAHSRRE
jgi:phosphoenolpyruvate carboxylase